MLPPEMRAAECAAALRPVQERVLQYTRRAQVESYLAGRGYVLFPGASWDLTDARERDLAVEWVLRLLEELGA